MATSNKAILDEIMVTYAGRPIEDQHGITREATELIMEVHELLARALNEDVTPMAFVAEVGGAFAAHGVL